MITETDIEKIKEISKKYHVKRVLLFGSSIESDIESNDIDIGVEGLYPEDFFPFYGDLIFALSKPVDIVDLSIQSSFVERIKQKGVYLVG